MGKVLECHYSFNTYEVEFVVAEEFVTIILEAEDIDLLEEGDKIRSDEKLNAAAQFLLDQLESVFHNIDKYKVKEGVDQLGIQKFIEQCARLAAATGAATGAWGPLSLLGLPVDIINNVVQQFRVTLAIIYDKTGKYKVGWEQFIKIVAVSVGVEAGVTVTKYMLLQIAKQIVTRLAAGGAGRLIPLVGAVVVGGVNYGFIKSIGSALQQIDLRNEF